MLWECSDSMPMQSVLPQCPDVHLNVNDDDDYDVENTHQEQNARRGIRSGNWTQQQQQQRHSSSTSCNNAYLTTNNNTRDLKVAHLPLPITMATEKRSLSFGGISLNDLCLYPDDDDDDKPENQQQQQQQQQCNDDNDNDKCHMYANDNHYYVSSDDDRFNDNDNLPSSTRASSSSSFANKHRRKIMMWAATFGLIAAIAIAIAIGMSVHNNSLNKEDAQLAASESASLENDKDTTTYHPTYSPTTLVEGTDSPVASSSSPSSLSSRPDFNNNNNNNNNDNVVESGANSKVETDQNDTFTSNPDTPTTQVLSKSPTLQPSNVSPVSSSGGGGEESIPIETIQFATTAPTLPSSASPTASSISSSNAQSNNLDLVSSGKDSSSATSTQSHLAIELQTDQHGEETSWTLHLVNEQTGSVSELIASVEENVYEPHEKDSIDLYLDPGKYRFTLKDAYGDGFCCSNGSAGSYLISLDGREIISGGYFRFEQSYDILVGYNPELTMSERDQEWVEAHNIRRKDWHERNGETYVPLVWSAELAKAALSWAQVLVENCEEETWHETSVSEGENLAQNIGSSGSSYAQLYPPENILKRWVDREEFVEYPGNLHLTQALWRATRYLGCGDAVKNYDDGSMCRVQVCRYVRTGNCNMGSYDPKEGKNWLIPMLMEHSKCGPECPPEGCF